jgi:hypothetical protein
MTPKEQSLALLRSAGRALGVGDFAGALEVLEHVRALDPSSPALADLTAMAEGQRAVAETRARRRAEFREHLDAASALLARNDLAAASARVTEALRLQPADPEARAIQGRIARKTEEEGLAAMPGRDGAAPLRPDARPGAAMPLPHEPATPPSREPAPPGPAGDVRAIPASRPSRRRKGRDPRRDPADDESDLAES